MAALVPENGAPVNVRAHSTKDYTGLDFFLQTRHRKRIFLEDSATILVDGEHLRRWQLERVARRPNTWVEGLMKAGPAHRDREAPVSW